MNNKIIWSIRVIIVVSILFGAYLALKPTIDEWLIYRTTNIKFDASTTKEDITSLKGKIQTRINRHKEISEKYNFDTTKLSENSIILIEIKQEEDADIQVCKKVTINTTSIPYYLFKANSSYIGYSYITIKDENLKKNFLTLDKDLLSCSGMILLRQKIK